MTRTVDLVAPLVALAEAGIPPDVQELLVQGDPMRGISPGALAKAIDATALAACAEELEKVKRERDNLRARVAELEGALRDARFLAEAEHMVLTSWGKTSSVNYDGIMARIDAALATQSQPRVAGGGQPTPPVNQSEGADRG